MQLKPLLSLALSSFFFATAIFAQTTTPFIKIDQFGYFPNSKKVAVINDPQNGYNAAESFSPSTGASGFKKGANNSLKENNYSFVDGHPIVGINYYRLKQIDNGGKTRYSKIEAVQNQIIPNTITLYPNPVSNILTVDNWDGKTVEIVDTKGQVVYTVRPDAQNKDLTKLTFNLSALPSGIYFLKTANMALHFVKN